MAEKRKKQTDIPVFHFSPRPNRAAEIGWREWGSDAFQLSRELGKPVLLAISATWCHWCHVMDETSYSDNEVISLINENFIPVRVDSDRRPDINSRYNQGGWPTIAFLTPEGEMIAGLTYVPQDQMPRLLGDITDIYTNKADKLNAAVEQVQKQRAEIERPAAAEPDESVMAYVLKVIGETHDEELGGFGFELKFPYPAALSFLLDTLADGYIETVETMVKTTLDAMAAGGMYDKVEGGFFRYSTTRDWTVPHYEKMLEDNAALMAVYSDAFLHTEDAGYERVARDVYRYLTTVLLNPETGAFAGSQDADEDYYSQDAEGRAQMKSPMVDPTVFAGANAVAASGLLRAFQIFGDKDYRDRAVAALEFVFNNLWSAGEGPWHYHDGEPRMPGLLVDAARLLPACLDAYESGAGELWLDRAIKVAAWLQDNLEDPDGGGFFDCREPLGAEGFLAERDKPIVENSLAAAALVRLAQSTGRPRFGDAAHRALACFVNTYKENGIFAADYAAAVQRLLDLPVRVTIAGPPSEDATVEMIRAVHLARIPFRSVEILDPELHGEELEATGYGYQGKPVAYICIGASCQPLVMDPAELPERLEKGRRS